MLAAGVTRDMLENKKIAIKPNLVISKKPEAAATTHPVFLQSAIAALKMFGAENTTLIVAESAGGPYTTATIKNHYSVCGIDESCGASLNYSTDAQMWNVHSVSIKILIQHIMLYIYLKAKNTDFRFFN